MLIYWKSHGKRPLGGMAMVGETYGSFVDTKPIKSKEENADILMNFWNMKNRRPVRTEQSNQGHYTL